jgi:hypothetical protein
MVTVNPENELINPRDCYRAIFHSHDGHGVQAMSQIVTTGVTRLSGGQRVERYVRIFAEITM